MDKAQFKEISQDQFTLVQRDESIFDTKFETKPIGYFKDAWLRFRKNKASVVAFIILILMVLFAIFAPIFSPYSITDNEPEFTALTPRVDAFAGSNFLGGTKVVEMTDMDYQHYRYQPDYVVEVIDTYQKQVNNRFYTYHKVRVDVYEVGYKKRSSDMDEIAKIREYEKEHDVQILYPLVDIPSYYDDTLQAQDSNWFYQTMQDPSLYDADYYEANKNTISKNYTPYLDDNGEIVPLYKVDSEGNYVYYESTGVDAYDIRVHYMEYYKMYHNGKGPTHLFGTNKLGQDIMTRLSVGARFSLLLGVVVALANIAIGIVYGAIEGYYGGTVDLVMERISDILSQVPFMIVAVLFNLYLSQSVGILPTLGFAFILTGWIGTASRVRMQFYRYKGQEYVLAARTLGAKDSRLIFRHILPNAIGTIITSCVLMIPSVIFSESTLSYLGVIDLETSTTITSVGSVLHEGQGSLQQYPHIILFPALFIAILMVSFNTFGRGLRDAFNPSLRGVEE